MGPIIELEKHYTRNIVKINCREPSYPCLSIGILPLRDFYDFKVIKAFYIKCGTTVVKANIFNQKSKCAYVLIFIFFTLLYRVTSQTDRPRGFCSFGMGQLSNFRTLLFRPERIQLKHLEPFETHHKGAFGSRG